MSKLETRFPKKRILITGATTGFGEALAYALAERGWSVAVTGRKPDAVKRTADEVTRRGGQGLGQQLEVREKAQWEVVRRKLQETWGGIDILVNNAGVADANKMVDMSDEAWESVLATNLDGVINGCRTYAPDMLKQQSGYILNVASAAGLLAMPEMANYNVSKSGVVALSETLSTELCGAGIGVTVLCPSAFKSSLLDKATRDGRDASANSSMGRFLQKDMDQGAHTSETVAAYAIKAMEKGHLYSIPQPLYRLAWAAKRIAPNRFYKTVGWLYRKQLGPFSE
ncbi:MAG: SDR family NAD(P)-dependent oxidoreductase [Pseudomonadota bacterium]|nr:SDR family NAD(P)-dependent oxidoreductase [Pseudomonadota bacterium]